MNIAHTAANLGVAGARGVMTLGKAAVCAWMGSLHRLKT